MNRSITAILSAAALIALLSGCASTSLKIVSLPDGAKTSISARPTGFGSWELKDQVQSSTNYVIKNKEEYFGKNKVANVKLVFQKEGYADSITNVPIHPGQENDPGIVRLRPLDTVVSISSTPQGAHLSFYASADNASNGVGKLPVPLEETITQADESEMAAVGEKSLLKMELSSKTTPWRLNCTADYASKHLSSIHFVRVELEDCVPQVKPLDIQAGVGQSVEFNLVPAVVTLNIRSNPSGAIVEDVRPGGFGKLGETELNTQITYKQLQIRPEFLNKGRLEMDLRGFKEGYTEWNRTNINIPLGEKYTVEFNLEPRIVSVRFDSEPANASVYVIEKVTSSDLEDQKNPDAQFKKQLGITPFTYNIDPDKPLKHGKSIFFEKDGYVPTEVVFAKGQLVIHGKLEPIKPRER